MNPDAVQLAAWLACLFFVAGGVNQVMRMVDRARGHPPNEELKGGADVMSQRVASLEKEAQEAMVRRRAMHERIDGAEKRVREEVKRDTELIHEKINNVAREVSALNAKTELQNQQLQRIETSVMRLTERKH